MPADHSQYRTLIRGVIEQTTALAVGGTPGSDASQDVCYRDGRGRLTIPGTGLAGALIETAVRIFPALIAWEVKDALLGGQITGKQRNTPRPRRGSDQDSGAFFQSVWRFRHAHLMLVDERTEWRQGVGIRQATGASASEKKALYDFEVVPRGACWDFFLEVDTFRGGAEAEAVAVIALNEWVQERGWLGRGPARGTGWIRLMPRQVFRLGRTPSMLEIWPDNTKPLDQMLNDVVTAGGRPLAWGDILRESQAVAGRWARGSWYYLNFPITLGPDAGPGEYGWDVLQVAGHPAGELNPSAIGILEPLSVGSVDWRSKEFKQPDAPFVSTQPSGQSEPQPFLPGSGIRGPLRHTAGRLSRATGAVVRDLNHPRDAEETRLRTTLEMRRRTSGFVPDSQVRAIVDAMTSLFGAEELCGRVLVSDAYLTRERFRMARVEHHAEDEFTAGVYGTGKFDCNVLIEGPMSLRIVLEAPSLMALEQMARRLLPALELARLGHLPIGGGKWRGAGWGPWIFGLATLARVGSEQPVPEDDPSQEAPLPVRFDRLLSRWKEAEYA
jgi:CRISPR/Cas system CSM-associated protein Csm3 (group 7 of RAMP superfamily)